VAKVTARVPDEVIGDPATENIEGIVKATLVTVPPLATLKSIWPATEFVITKLALAEAKNPYINVAKAAVVETPVPPFNIGNIPLTPLVRLISGISAATRPRKVGTAAEPDVGPANTRFIDSTFKVNVKVPAVVTGEPETVNIDGADKATLVTGPVPLSNESVNVCPQNEPES